MIHYCVVRYWGNDRPEILHISEDLSGCRFAAMIWQKSETWKRYEYQIQTWENGQLTGTVPIEEEIDG